MTNKTKPLKRGRGKPRRGNFVGVKSAVRIDQDSKTVLQREFGSLGNALYYLAQGIMAFRKLHKLPHHDEQPNIVLCDACKKRLAPDKEGKAK